MPDLLGGPAAGVKEKGAGGCGRTQREGAGKRLCALRSAEVAVAGMLAGMTSAAPADLPKLNSSRSPWKHVPRRADNVFHCTFLLLPPNCSDRIISVGAEALACGKRCGIQRSVSRRLVVPRRS